MKQKKGKKGRVDWDEIFDSIDLDYLPLTYITNVLIKFNDGTTWDINVEDSLKTQSIDEVEESLSDLFEEYDTDIQNVEFEMDMKRLSHDLGKRVTRFIKFNK